MKVRLGKKAIAEELLEIAAIYIDSCEDEYHSDSFYTATFLVTLARSYLK